MKNGNRRATTRINSALLIGVFFILAAVVAVPVYTTKSAAQSLKAAAGSSSIRFFTPFSSAMSPLSSFWLLPNPQAPAEMIETFASDCITPKTDFDLGETVCAKITGAPLAVDDRAQRRIGWVSPYGSLAQGAEITTDPQNGTYLIPTDQTQTFTDSGGGTVVVDNRGTWTVNTFSAADGSLKTSANFTVHDPATPYVDLSVGQSVSEAGSTVGAGSSSKFRIIVSNRGPDAGANVVLAGAVPNDSTFVAMTQTSGPTFNCTTPTVGGTGAISCTIASLAKDATATFDMAYNVNAGTPNGTLITSNATISSDTAEMVADDNASTRSATVGAGGGGGGDCTLICPANITVTANTTEGGQDGAHVTFAQAESTGTCGAITYSHTSGSFFPVGETVVSVSSETGDGNCAFRINVEEAGNTTISCPANQTATANAACAANISAGTASATGTNVTVTALRSDGKAMYDCDINGTNCTRRSTDFPFMAGTTTITWIAYSHSVPGPYSDADDEESKRTGSASCTQTIVVDDVTAPAIGATDQTIAADANCQAVVPDYISTVTDNCACASSDASEACEDRTDFTYTQSPAPGTVVGQGSHEVTITANDRSSNNNGAGNETTKVITLTVADQTAPVISCQSNIVVSNDPGQCSAMVDPGTASATDNCDSSPTIVGTRSDNQPLNAPYPKGLTIITWSATDDAGNTSSCNQSVTVNDTELPTISCPANIIVYVAPNSTATSAVVNYQTPVGADNCASNTTQTAGLASGAAFPVGTTTNTFKVTDASGNVAECSFTVTVLYNFTGFFSPVSNPPVVNNVNAGRSIPLKFSLSGNKGLSIFAAGYPASQPIACNSSAPLADLEGTESSGGSSLTYSPDQYHYSWKTESSWAGTCRLLVVKLNDGSAHTAIFKFK